MACLNALRRLVSLCCLAACVAASDEACEAPMTLSSFAHALNEKFIAKVGEGRAREFRPELLPARVADSSLELHLVEPSSERFFTYASDNGWNNQLLNLLCGLDMARSLNRTLIVPPLVLRGLRDRSRLGPFVEPSHRCRRFRGLGGAGPPR